MVRLTATPHTAQDLAHSLARRADTSWVKLDLRRHRDLRDRPHAARRRARHSLLLHDIPRTREHHRGVGAPSCCTAISAARPPGTGGRAHWTRPADAHSTPARVRHRSPQPLTGDDHALMAALRQRTAARATPSWPRPPAGRRRPSRAGWPISRPAARSSSTSRSTTPPSASRPTRCSGCRSPRRTSTASRPRWPGTRSSRFVAATTGPTNLVAHALCPTRAALHHYLTHRLGALDPIRTLETAPVLRTLKAAGHLTPAFGGSAPV